MKLDQLLEAEIYRDGGSLEASFLTNEGLEWSVCLEIDRRFWLTDVKSYEHLYECRFSDLNSGDIPHVPIPTGSPREREILAALQEWVDSNPLREEHGSLNDNPFNNKHRQRYLLLQMIEQIPQRAPC